MTVKDYIELLDESNVDVYVNSAHYTNHIASAFLGSRPFKNIIYIENMDKEIKFITHNISKETGGVVIILHLM